MPVYFFRETYFPTPPGNNVDHRSDWLIFLCLFSQIVFFFKTVLVQMHPRLLYLALKILDEFESSEIYKIFVSFFRNIITNEFETLKNFLPSMQKWSTHVYLLLRRNGYFIYSQ